MRSILPDIFKLGIFSLFLLIFFTFTISFTGNYKPVFANNSNVQIKIVGRPQITNPGEKSKPIWVWQTSGDPGQYKYIVEWSGDRTFSKGVSFGNSNANSFQQPSPLPSGVWYLRVLAADNLGNHSDFSGYGAVAVERDGSLRSLTPIVPAGFSAHIVDPNQAKLAWNFCSAYGFRVWGSKTSDKEGFSVVGQTNNLIYTADLNNGYKWYYVTSFDSYGHESDPTPVLYLGKADQGARSPNAVVDSLISTFSPIVEDWKKIGS